MVCANCEAGQRLPILMLTARDAVEDRISGHGFMRMTIILDQAPLNFGSAARLRALLRALGNCVAAQITFADLSFFGTGAARSSLERVNISVTTKDTRCWNFWRSMPAV